MCMCVCSQGTHAMKLNGLWEGGQDSRCGNFHNDSTLGVRLDFSEWLGHPISCDLPTCFDR